MPNSFFLCPEPSFLTPLNTQKGYLTLATTSLQLINSVNFLRITTGHFLSVWPRNYSNSFLIKIPKRLRLPKECLSNSQVRALLVCFLESVLFFIHSFTPQGQTVSHAYFCRHCETFSRFYVRSFCKWNPSAKVLSGRLSWGLQEMPRTTKCAFISGAFEVGKHWIGLSQHRWCNLNVWQNTELQFWKGHQNKIRRCEFWSWL